MLTGKLSYIILPVAASTTAVVPDFVAANEQMNFSPYVFSLLLLTAMLLCMIAVLLYHVYELRQSQRLIGRGVFNLDSSRDAQILEPIFDYRQVETPEEFIQYTEQSTLAMQEAIARLSVKPKYVPRHQKKEEEVPAETTNLPRIRLLPEMKHARRKAAHAAEIQIPEELEELLRKIS